MPLLGTNLIDIKTPIHAKMCYWMFMVALFIIVKNGVKYIHHLMNIQMWHIHKMVSEIVSSEPQIQLCSVTQCPTFCNPMDCSMPSYPVHHQHLKPAQTHVIRVGDATHPLLSPSPPTFNLSHHQGLIKWVSFSHQVGKVSVFQL